MYPFKGINFLISIAIKLSRVEATCKVYRLSQSPNSLHTDFSKYTNKLKGEQGKERNTQYSVFTIATQIACPKTPNQTLTPQIPYWMPVPALAPTAAPAPLRFGSVQLSSVRCGSSGLPRHVNIIKLCTNKSNQGAAKNKQPACSRRRLKYTCFNMF